MVFLKLNSTLCIFKTVGFCYSPMYPFKISILYNICCCYCSVTQAVWLCVTSWTAACKTFLSFTISWSVLKLISIELVMPSNHLILSRPLLLMLSIFPSTRVFSNESALQIRWPKYWNFSFNISPASEYSGLISFSIDWLDRLAVQGRLQHHSSKGSILWHSAFCMVQLWHPCMTTGKTTALTRLALLAKSIHCFLIGCVGLLVF